jgi:hypothetical protein
MESLKRDEKIEDWDRHRQGQGYRSKLKSQKAEDDSIDPNNPKPKPKKRLFRPDYNPLTGSSSGPSYRPSRQSGLEFLNLFQLLSVKEFLLQVVHEVKNHVRVSYLGITLY